MRLLGGCPGSSSKGPVSFKDVVKGRSNPHKKSDIPPNIPDPYIVE